MSNISATGFSFSVPGEPAPWARAGGGKSVVRFTPARQRSYMGALKFCCARAMGGTKPLEGPLRIDVIAYYAWPKSFSVRKRAAPGAAWKTSRPDIDNACIKLVCDALNTVAWLDDSQVAMAVLRKMYGDVPALSISIRPLANRVEARPSPAPQLFDARSA